MNVKIIVTVVVIAAAMSLFVVSYISSAPLKKHDHGEKAHPSAEMLHLYSAEEGRYVDLPAVVKTQEQWKEELSPERYHILRDHGTERAFTSDLLENKVHGVYRCGACGNDLFHSDHKYKSGTGWPSFDRPIAAENIANREDRSYFMLRNEIVCARCGSHLGHVFDDGPASTGERYCINGRALTFHPLEK